MAAVPITTKDGKQIGILKGGVLYKNAKKSRHLFHKVGGNGSWGIDYDVLFNQIPERCSIRISESEENILYMANAALWRERGEVLHFKDVDDHDVQVFLPIEYFDKVKM